jgi:hypothetical protein
MVRIVAALLLCLLASFAAPARAESLSCAGGIASEGDSRLSVLYKCGQPQLADTACAPVVYAGTLYYVPEPFASTYVPCQLTEQWLYERGAGNMIAVVRIRGGNVQSIVYGRQPH